MSCTRPLFRLPTIQEGLPRDMRHRIKYGAIILRRNERDDLIKFWNKTEDMFQQIPCGQCADCRLEYSRQWAIRCVLESSYYDFNWFLTLTYDDEHLPKGRLLNLETGEIMLNSEGQERRCLESKDLQDFLKRLRISATRKGLRGADGIEDCRNFSCGEYGEKTERPHFHSCIFGLEIPDLQPLFVKDGYRYFSSDWINKVWGKGFVVVGQFNFDTAAYVSRYVMKKQKGKGLKEFKSKVKKVLLPDEFGGEMIIQDFQEEFCRMSRRPGIGKRYFEEHKKDIYATDSLFVKSSKGLMKVKPPKYFDNLFGLESPEEIEKLKEQRRAVGKAKELQRRQQTTMSDIDYNIMREQKREVQLKKLKRDVE